jgi:hypothetical protein
MVVMVEPFGCTRNDRPAVDEAGRRIWLLSPDEGAYWANAQLRDAPDQGTTPLHAPAAHREGVTNNIVRGRDVGGAPNDTRFGEHKRPSSDVTLSATDPKFAPLPKLVLQNYNRSVDHVISPRMRDEFELDTPYQRGAVWDEERRRDLIRSSLMGLPIGAITVNERPFKAGRPQYAVVDGRQRIETFRAFVDDEFPIPGTWLDADEDIAETVEVPGWPVRGVYHSGMTVPAQRGFSFRPLVTQEASVKTIAQEAEIFRLLNAGGVAQTEETMANALAVEEGRAG